MRKRLIFVNSHPIQYFAPLYRQIAADGGFDLEVFYASDESMRGARDAGFGVAVKWDVPLLEGYRGRFFANYSPKPSIHNGFFGLFNPGLWRALFAAERSLVVVHGWGYLTTALAIVFAKLVGHTVCLRGESPLNQELRKSPRNRWLKRRWLKGFLFRFVDRFLYIGQQNRLFYEAMGVPAERLAFAPYCVDNARFSAEAARLAEQKTALRRKRGIPETAKIVLFCGKYIHKKRPLDALEAFKRLNRDDAALVMVGEGELRPQMERFIRENGLRNVTLTGFVNQTALPEYYALSDVFLLPSGDGETWGLVVNEALNFGLPVVMSDAPGSAYDLVDGNGHVFPLGDIEALAERLSVLLDSQEARQLFGQRSKQILRRYDYATIVETLRTL